MQTQPLNYGKGFLKPNEDRASPPPKVRYIETYKEKRKTFPDFAIQYTLDSGSAGICKWQHKFGIGVLLLQMTNPTSKWLRLMMKCRISRLTLLIRCNSTPQMEVRLPLTYPRNQIMSARIKGLCTMLSHRMQMRMNSNPGSFLVVRSK